MPDPVWWAVTRRAITFILGCVVIVDSLLGPTTNTGELIVGLILVGVLPIDDLLRVVRGRGRNDDRG